MHSPCVGWVTLMACCSSAALIARSTALSLRSVPHRFSPARKPAILTDTSTNIHTHILTDTQRWTHPRTLYRSTIRHSPPRKCSRGVGRSIFNCHREWTFPRHLSIQRTSREDKSQWDGNSLSCAFKYSTMFTCSTWCMSDCNSATLFATQRS